MPWRRKPATAAPSPVPASSIGEEIDDFIDLGCQVFTVYCNAARQMASLEQLASLRPQGPD